MSPWFAGLAPFLVLLLDAPGAFGAASAASESCAQEEPAPPSNTKGVQLMQRVGLLFVGKPLPEKFDAMQTGQEKRLESSGLVKMALNVPDLQNLWVFGYPSSEDRYVSEAVRTKGSWEGDGVQMLCDVFNKFPGAYSFLDVGGNIGTITLPMAAFLAKRGGRVFSVEAMPSIAEHLKAGIVANELKNVDLYNYAISDPSAKDDLVMALQPWNKGGSAVEGNKPWTFNSGTTKVRVPLTTLDSMLDSEPELRNVLVAKMDIEGNEGKALKGATRLLKEAPPCYLMIELSADFLGAAGTPIEEVTKLLADAGYDVSAVHSYGIDTYRLQQKDLGACLKRLGASDVAVDIPGWR